MAGIEVQTRSEPARTATKTMRAAVVEDFTKPLVLRDVAKPTAGVGEIVVRVETSGSATPTSTRPTATGR